MRRSAWKMLLIATATVAMTLMPYATSSWIGSGTAEADTVHLSTVPTSTLARCAFLVDSLTIENDRKDALIVLEQSTNPVVPHSTWTDWRLYTAAALAAVATWSLMR